jgi:hypothetical protein
LGSAWIQVMLRGAIFVAGLTAPTSTWSGEVPVIKAFASLCAAPSNSSKASPTWSRCTTTTYRAAMTSSDDGPSESVRTGTRSAGL